MINIVIINYNFTTLLQLEDKVVYRTETVVSVIVPIYNVENYIEKCICSILQQSYRRLEIILVDDGSTDKSLNICKSYEKEDSRIKVLTKSNEGVSVARNCGIEMCNGDFIIFIDADDWIESDYIENILPHLSQMSDLWITDYTIDDGDSLVRKNSFNNEFTISDEQEIIALKKSCLIPQYHFLKQFKSDSFLAGVWGKIFKSSIIKGNNIRFIKELKISEDIMFLLKYLDNCHRVTYFREYGYHYVVRQTSAIRKLQESLFENYIVYIEKLDSEISQKKLQNIDVSIVYAIAVRMLYTFFANGFFLKVFDGNTGSAERYIDTIIEKRLGGYILANHIPYLEFRHKIMLFFIKNNKSKEFLKVMKIKNNLNEKRLL